MPLKNSLLHNLHTAKEEAGFLLLLKKGDKNAFSKLYDLYAGVLYNYLLRYAADEQEAEHLLQKTFLFIYKTVHTYNAGAGHLFGWILKQAKAVCNENKAQAQNNVGRTEIHLAEKSVDLNSENTEMSERSVAGHETNATISASKHSALDLVYLKGYSVTDAAKKLGLQPEDLRKKIRQELNSIRGSQGK